MEVKIPELFDYQHAVVPEDCHTLISPSQLSKFFDYPKIWYLENLTGQKPEFQGNTSTVTGTICHHIYECVAQDKPVTREWINSQLTEYLAAVPNENVDPVQVMSTYPLVSAAVVNEYVIPHKDYSPILCEQQIVQKVDDGIYIAGTYDRLEGTVLCDFKTVSVKPNENTIPFHYKIQLLAYAYCLRKQGVEVDRIRIIYGVKPTKTLPARCIAVTEQIDEEAEKLIENTLQLVCDSIKKVKECPELAYLLFKSMDLKESN